MQGALITTLIVFAVLAAGALGLSACAGEFDPYHNEPLARPFPEIGPGQANVPAQQHGPGLSQP